MRRLSIMPVVAILAALTLTASAGAASASTKIQLKKTDIGSILMSAQGFPLYAFTRDGSRKDRCVALSGCAAVWPPVLTKGKPVGGPGVKSNLLGTITINGGKKQVTYGGHPLYTYAGDIAGQTGYVNVTQFGGRWPALNASGAEVK